MVRDNPVCLKKRRYTDECQARAAAMDSLERHPGEDKLYVYRCNCCAGWHLTKSNHGRKFLVTVNNPAQSVRL